MTDKNITPTQNFQEKVAEKVKDAIGDLITAEDLVPLIEESVKKILTEERTVQKAQGYGYETVEPLLEQLIKPHLDKQLRELADDYFTAHPEELSKAIKEVLGDGILKAMQRVIENRMQQPIYELTNKIEEVFRNNNIQM